MLCAINQGVAVATPGNHIRIAVAGQDAGRIEPPKPFEIVEMRLEVLWFIDIGDRVLHRVAAEEKPALGQPDHRRVVTVNVNLDQLDAEAANVELVPLSEDPSRQDQWIDSRRSLV